MEPVAAPYGSVVFHSELWIKGCRMVRKPKPTDIVAVKVRMREALRQSLEFEAKRRDISLNKEIERRLEKSFELAANAVIYSWIADAAVDEAYARIGLRKPSDMIDLIKAKLGDEAANEFAAGLADSAARKERFNE